MLEAGDGPARRQVILEAVAKVPGIHKSRLRDELDLPWGSLTHHLHYLHRQGQVRFLRVGHRVAVYPRGVPEIERAAYELMARPEVQEVARGLALCAPATIQDVTAQVVQSRKVARRCLLALESAGAVDRQGRGWGRFDFTPLGRRLLATFLD